MNKLTSLVLGTVFLVLSVISLQAQDSTLVYIEDQQVEPMQVINVDVKVTNFNDILSAAFGMSWDTNQLRYVGIENIALNVPMENFNTMFITEGRISYLFFDNSLVGESLEDESLLFTLQLEVLGMDGDASTIVFTGSNLDNEAEVIDADENIVGAFTQATIMIGDPNNTVELAEYGYTAQVMPNPFKDNANVQLQVERAGEVYWVLSDVNGRTLAEGQQYYGAGEHSLVLNNRLFTEAGTYVLQLKMGDTVISRRLLRI